MMGDKYEMFVAELESARNEACEAYFKARPQLFVTAEKEKIFEAGFERAYKQQAETIELLKHGMKGDYDLDQWLDWAVNKKHMMETIERLKDANTEAQQALEELADKIESSLYKRSRDDSVIEFHNGPTYETSECDIKPSDILKDIRSILATGKLNKLEVGEL